MKNTRTHLLIILPLLLSLTACQPMVKIIFGIKQPKPKSEKQLEHQIKKRNLKHAENYSLGSINDFMKVLADDGYRNLEGNDVFSFNNKGQFLLFIDTLNKSCIPLDHHWINNLSDTALYQPLSEDTLNFRKFSNLFHTLDNTPVQRILNPNADYTLIVLWASFVGRWNNQVFRRLEGLDTLRNINVDIIYLNYDLKKTWDLDSLEK